MYDNLYKWGLTERFEREAQMFEGLFPARVTEQRRNIYKVVCEDGFLRAAVSGKFAHAAGCGPDFPAVGDWVMISAEHDAAVIHHVLARKSVFGRKAAGTTAEAQIIASNIDTVFICMALNEDYNLRRLERYLAVAWDGDAAPVVVLTKSDLCENLEQRYSEVSKISLGADVIICSNVKQDGYSDVTRYINQGETVAFIGSSGVGKSTLINYLLDQDILVTKEIRKDGKGRHATTHRQLMLLPCGGLVMDTPGIRELGTVSADLEKTFADIEELAERCKFRDCSHTSEPGCAVRAALEDGNLDAARLGNYNKIQMESGYSGLSSRQIEEEKIKRMFGG
ncbi:MAG: ribosome small subunit-dependent GTPase A, partial [Planctomycetes bacterium]|nr:ribosome small subunit-dependent GTPase A [Planctomycetota bacterium]